MSSSRKIIVFFSDLNKPVEEIEPACRQATLDNHAWMQEWMDRRSLEPHVFGDILEQVQKESIPERLDFFSRRDVVQTLPLKKKQFCYSHGQCCQLPKAGETDLDVSGLPCQENSRINVNRQFMEGKTGSVYLVWAKSNRAKRTPLLILENTEEPLFQIHSEYFSFSFHYYDSLMLMAMMLKQCLWTIHCPLQVFNILLRLKP